MKNVSQEALLALELFRLSPNSKTGLSQIHEHLVEVSMYSHPDATKPPDIINACSEILSQPYSLSEHECKEALNNGCKMGRIQEKNEENYGLSDKVIEDLTNRQKKFSEAEIAFNKGLIENVGKSIKNVVDPLADPLLCSITREVIQETFYASSVKLYSLLSSKEDIISAIDNNSNIENQLSEKLKTFLILQKNTTADDVIKGIRVFLSNLDAIQRYYIGNLHRRVFYFQILNLDPRLQDIQKKSFENIKLYLDTNVVMNYLCDGTKLYQAVCDILNTSISLGVKLYVSPITIRESEALINDALRHSVYINNEKIWKIMQASPNSLSNPVIESFKRQKSIHPNLNWEAYVSPLKNLEDYLLANNVLLEKEFTDDIEKDAIYEEVYKEISIIKNEKDDGVRVHDASNFVLIHKLREKYKGTLLGSSVWLITLDNKLPKLDRHMQRKLPLPHCRLLEQWGELLVNFQNVGKYIVSDDYVTYLASQELGAYIQEETLDIHVFDSIAKAEVVYDKILSLEPEIASGVIQDLQQSREKNELLQQLHDIPKDKSNELVGKVISEIESLQIENVEKLKNRANEEITRLENGIQNLKQELRKLDKERHKDNETIKTISDKLKSTEDELAILKNMSFWDKLRLLIRSY